VRGVRVRSEAGGGRGAGQPSTQNNPAGVWDMPAAAVVSNMDVVPTYRRLLPGQAEPRRILEQPRSTSALIFYWGMGRRFHQLDLHNILFSADYPGEFRHLSQTRTLTDDPTVYLYLSCRSEPGDAPPDGENWFAMINAPHDAGQDWDELCKQARRRILAKVESVLGEPVEPHIRSEFRLDPRGIEARTSSYLGALYGNSSDNPMAAFLRHPNFSRQIAGLYFCGGSVHPGGGIPLCLLSARITAEHLQRRSPNPQT
jgi:diapolycopene oxygenase